MADTPLKESDMSLTSTLANWHLRSLVVNMNPLCLPFTAVAVWPALLVLLPGSVLGSLPSLALPTLVLLPQCLGLELVPVAVDLREPAWMCQLLPFPSKGGGLVCTYSTACLGRGSSVVKYACCRASAAVGRLAGS